MQLFSIGVEERDIDIKKALIRKVHIGKPDGLNIEQKKSGDLLFLNYISDRKDNPNIGEIRKKLKEYMANIISEIILEDLQS